MTEQIHRSKLNQMISNINILGVDIPVLYQEVVMFGDEEVMGLSDFEDDSIQILDKPNIKYETKLRVLVHECFEHINYKLEMGLKHSQITQLEAAVYHMLRENPNLAKAFQLYRTWRTEDDKTI